MNISCLQELNQYNQLVVGFSGGLDSTVLLHILASQSEILHKIMAVHINHGLSPNALDWQNHCQQICKKLDIRFLAKPVEFARHANIEEGARRARYAAFASVLAEGDCLILAHHRDDQAETLLLQLFRGTGIDGLAAMARRKVFFSGQLLRPLLDCTRQDLEGYAREHALRWIDDESNQNTVFTRNFLRQEILPLLDKRWPSLMNNLVRTAEHCQQAQRNLDALAKNDCPILEQSSLRLDLTSLSHLTAERLSNVLRFWFKTNKIRLPGTLTFNRLISEVIQANRDTQPLVAWKGYCVRRYQKTLYLMRASSQRTFSSIIWSSFPESLLIEGLGTVVVKKRLQGFQLLAERQFEIRFRQGGELFYWRGQTKQLKKLMQEWQIPPWQRHCIPLLYINGELAAIIGYALSDLFYTQSGPNRVLQHLELQLDDFEAEFF